MGQDIHERRKNLICELVEDELYVPMKEKELAMFLQVEPEDRPELSRLLNELLMEHKIQISKRGKYTKAESNVLCGTFIGNSKGFGFVEVEGFTQDYYIPAAASFFSRHTITSLPDWPPPSYSCILCL